MPCVNDQQASVFLEYVEARVAQRVTLLSLLSYSTNFQCPSITQYTLAKHEHLKNMIPVKSQETGARKTKSSSVAQPISPEARG